MKKTPLSFVKRQRRKPTIKVKKTKDGLEIIKTMYDQFGKVMQKQIEAVRK